MQNKIRFSTKDGASLAGVLHSPNAGTPHAHAVFAHCFTCTKNNKAAINIAEALCQQGIAVLRFDFTGLGQSEGEFADTHFSSNVQDLVDAANYLSENYSAPAILVGHSLGGTACLAAAAQVPSIRAVATIGSPAEAEHVLGLLQDDIATIEQQGEARVKLAGQSFSIRKDFVDDVRAQRVRDGIRTLRRALLVMHSPVDELVSIDEAARIYSSALHPKSFVSLDKADHLLSKEADSHYAGQLLAAWASRYLDHAEEPIAAARYQPDEVVVSGRPDDIFRVAINANGHSLLGDEPESYGGQDSGPSPYDYLSAALASCTVMTLNMYARRKQLPLQRVEVSVKHGKIHAEDCADCKTKAGKIDRFERQLSLIGDLSEEQRQRMIEIADMCPVHKTLHAEVDIKTELL